jgi:hypothetical protein
MAQLLYERHSAKVHLNTVKRHIRLARQINGADDLATTIEPWYTDLAAKAVNSNLAKEECEHKRDLLALKDALLDDKVRDLFEAAKKYDRDNPGIPVATLLFPGGVSPVIYAPVESEPTLVAKIIIAIQDLGEAHPLASNIEPLQTAIYAVKAAIAELYTAIEAEKTAEASEAIAKIKLTRQYEQNFYAAGSKFGKAFAGRLFPVIRAVSKNVEEEVNTESVK